MAAKVRAPTRARHGVPFSGPTLSHWPSTSRILKEERATTRGRARPPPSVRRVEGADLRRTVGPEISWLWRVIRFGINIISILRAQLGGGRGGQPSADPCPLTAAAALRLRGVKVGSSDPATETWKKQSASCWSSSLSATSVETSRCYPASPAPPAPSPCRRLLDDADGTDQMTVIAAGVTCCRPCTPCTALIRTYQAVSRKSQVGTSGFSGRAATSASAWRLLALRRVRGGRCRGVSAGVVRAADRPAGGRGASGDGGGPPRGWWLEPQAEEEAGNNKWVGVRQAAAGFVLAAAGCMFASTAAARPTYAATANSCGVAADGAAAAPAAASPPNMSPSLQLPPPPPPRPPRPPPPSLSPSSAQQSPRAQQQILNWLLDWFWYKIDRSLEQKPWMLLVYLGWCTAGYVLVAGAYTRPLLSSTWAVSVTRKHPSQPKDPQTRATRPLRAPPIPHKALKLSW